MSLRNLADWRTVMWVAMAVTLVAIQYAWPSLVVYLCPISCYLATACGVIAHNHNHSPTFVSRRVNNAFGHLLTIFYGYPTLMWIPTHNLNHHRYNNRAGDATITWRYTNKHNLLVALSYPFVSGYFQSKPIKQYIAKAKLDDRKLYSRIVFQYVFWISVYVLMLVVAGLMHHQQQTGLGLYVWFFSLILPAIFSATVIMVFNFIQHVHADASSELDHSRNFTGKVFNFLFFNNGFHTVHHHRPGLHWTDLPAAHARVSHQIDPRLNERNLCWFLVRQYFLALVFPSLGTSQIGQAPDSDTLREEASLTMSAASQHDSPQPH